MTQTVQITEEENEDVQSLFLLYTSYINILKLFAESDLANTEVYNKRWNDAVVIGAELEQAKHEIELKYKPEGTWDNFMFDFEHEQVIFSNERL